jgi:DNA invertase Pin-like site-specific DNA recombinase
MKANGETGKAIAKHLGVSRATLYRYLTEDTAANGPGSLAWCTWWAREPGNQ